MVFFGSVLAVLQVAQAADSETQLSMQDVY